MGCENPLRWDCDKRGCFNKKQRPKIEVFAECLPRKCAFGDVDAITEIGGRALVLEWKPANVEISTGQRIMWERFTRGGMISTIVIAGDAETMEVSHLGIFYDGKWHGWENANLALVKSHITDWAQWADANPWRGLQ